MKKNSQMWDPKTDETKSSANRKQKSSVNSRQRRESVMAMRRLECETRCPFQTQPGHPAVRPYLSQMFCRKYTLLARLPLSNSSYCWIVGFCCVLLAVAFHGLPAHRFKNCKSQAFPPSIRLTQRVFIAHVGVNSKNSSVRSSLPADRCNFGNSYFHHSDTKSAQGQCVIGNSASHDRPGHLSSLPQQ